MDEFLQDYILAHIDEEGAFLSALRREAHVKLLHPRMLSGHLQGRLLKMFCRMMAPKRVLEVGTYTGYATFCMAEALDDDAEIDTVEINDELEPFLTPYLERSPHREKIHVHWGDIERVLPSLEGVFDLVFIDGDKRAYCDYFDLIYPRVRVGGLLLVDNTLWSGKVVEEGKKASDAQTEGIRRFNEKIKSDHRVEKVILPLRDGLTMIWKRDA